MKTITTAYKCDHCGKLLIRKTAMEWHEKYCWNAMKNQTICQMCNHLEKVEGTETIWTSPYADSDLTRKITSFRCKLYDIKLHTVGAERKKLPQKYPERFNGTELMRTDCKGYTDDF